MSVLTLLEMAAAAGADRTAVGSRGAGRSYATLLAEARAVGTWIRDAEIARLGVLDLNSDLFPVLVFGAAAAGVPLAPLNYRLSDEQLAHAASRLAPVHVVTSTRRIRERVGVGVVHPGELGGGTRTVAGPQAPTAEPDDSAFLILTSGTTGAPKVAVLRHRHLFSYVIDTVAFFGAGPDEAALVSVPNYHIAGLSAVLSSVYAGRRLVYLPSFTGQTWVDLARAESVTHAMVVPTMLGRILEYLETSPGGLPDLRALSYGGGRMPQALIERALEQLPGVDLVNAYGLTETSSTIAILGPEDHRAAAASDDPAERARLGSVGRPLPTVELEIRASDGTPVPPGDTGEIFVRGPHVAGEYLSHAALDEHGWYVTRDRGYLDSGGFLFLTGRADDVIVRGGENISPGEVEERLTAHPAVSDAAVIGVADGEWGERVEAVVVTPHDVDIDDDELREWVRAELRSTRVPERIHRRHALPYNETGKLLRRVLREELAGDLG